ncbi:MAG TPA: DUF6600 domain-containing protein [Candidatus Polarisedimenticolaceae bacterium]|nr:DUF6600 domain-containing protein [Candidatus Polarisedimenticolaceae bacterium]
MNHRMLATFAFAAALIACGAPATRAQVDDAIVDDFAVGDFGRVRMAENGATVLRADADREMRDERLGINSPIFPGDQVRTGRDQRVEVQLAGGSLIRMDRDAVLTFQGLPDPYAEHPDNTVLALEAGSIQISAHPSSKEEFRIDTPSASVYLVGDGDFRIDVERDGYTSVLSRRGVAEVVGGQQSVLVRAGMLTEVSPGGEPSAANRFNVYDADAFDRWAADRDRIARQWGGTDGVASDDLPYTVRPYHRELSAYGSWAYDPTYGNIWYPSGMAAGWRPYYDGYWSYSPRGYFWISNEPWGWAPYHYGRWVHVPAYGWAWCPGQIFAGAWVSWSWGSAYIGWAPLSYWGYPVHYHDTLYHGYYDPDCWSFVRYDHFVVHDYSRYYVSVNHIHTHIGGNAVVTRPPRVAPHAIVTDAALRDRTWRDLNKPTATATRIPPIRRDAKPERRFVDVEDRVVRSGAIRKAADVRRAARTPDAIERPGRKSDVPPVRPRRITSATEVNPGRGADVRERPRPHVDDSRGRNSTGGRVERPRPQDDGARGRSPEVRERPRPQVDDSRGRVERPRPQDDGARGRSPEVRERPRPQVDDSRGRNSEVRPAERPRPGNELRDDGSDASRRLRDFYRDAGRPVEPRRPSETRARPPQARESARPREEPARPQPRAEGQRQPERPAPKAEPRREQSGNGSGRGASKKDDGNGGKSKGDGGGGSKRGHGRGR